MNFMFIAIGGKVYKYDLVSKNGDKEDIEKSLENCNFYQTGPEPEDSECMEIVSMRSC